MKYAKLLLLFAVFTSSFSYSQTKLQVVQDSIRVANGELIIRNGTKNVPGFLYNKGNGSTEFRRPLTKVSDTLYLVGIDSLKLKPSTNLINIQTLTDGATITWDLTNSVNGSVTLGGTGRSLVITNPVAGHTYRLKVKQDNTGGRTITTWPTSVRWPGGNAPTLSTDTAAIDLLTFFYDGTAFLGDYKLLYRNLGPDLSVAAFDTLHTSGANAVHSLATVPAGALLVIATSSDVTAGNATITSSPSLTWTKRADAQATASENAEIWTAVTSAGGNMSVTTNWGGGGDLTSVCYVVVNQESTLSGASATATLQSSPSVAITTTKAKSLIFGITSDYNAIDGASRTYRDAATEKWYYRNGNFTNYFYIKSAATAGAYTEGLTAPTGQASNTALLEIRVK